MTLDITKYKNVIKGALWKLNPSLSVDDVNDIIQEVYMKILQKRVEIREEDGVAGYFAFTTKSVYLDRWRRAQRRKGVSQTEDISLYHDRIPSIESNEEEVEEQLALILRYSKEFPLILQETLNLRLQGYEYEEIAKITESNIATVRGRIHKIKLTLQNKLKNKPSL